MQCIQIKNSKIYKDGKTLFTTILDSIDFSYNLNSIDIGINEESRLEFKISNLRLFIYDFNKGETVKKDYYRIVGMMKRFSHLSQIPKLKGRNVNFNKNIGWYIYTI